MLLGETPNFRRYPGVLYKRHSERIRLNGIDCPEKGQAYVKRAKQAASALVFGKEVTLQTFAKDKYGHTIADVLLPDGTNVTYQRSPAAEVLALCDNLFT